MCSANTLFLGVDPGITNTGVVLLNPDGTFRAALDGKAYHKGYKGFARFGKQAEGITGWLREHAGGKPIVCGYEGYSMQSVHRAYDMAEYGGVLKSALRQFISGDQPIYIIPPTMCKSFATGYGYATKDQMKEQAAIEAPELRGRSADVCDAYFLAKFAAFANRVYCNVNNDLLRHRIEKTMGYTNVL